MIKTPRKSPQLMELMGSLAEGTRLRLLRLLERHELGVVELCDVLQLPQSTVSRHLKLLADQRWVRSRSEGAANLYRTVLDELEPAARKLWLLAREQTDDWATVQQDRLRLERRLKEKQTNSQAFFAGAAGKWDHLRRELYGDSFTVAAMLSLLPREYVVADLGCGTGEVTAQIAPNVARIIGVDNSTAMLKAARKRIGDRDNVELVRGELDALPLEPASCDAAMLLLVLTYAADVAPLLREARRILKDGGKLVVVDLLPHDRDDFRRQMGQQHAGFDLEQIGAALVNAGFSHVNGRALSPEPAAKGPALFLASATAANRG